MSTFKNPRVTPKVTPFAVGALYVDRQAFDLSDAAYKPSALASGDKIQIGVVPAGCALVPQLSTGKVPILDTNGAATAAYTIGTADDADALLASKDGDAAVTVSPGDLLGATVGSPEEDTPIYLTLTAAAATLATSGVITCDWVFRAWQPEIDG